MKNLCLLFFLPFAISVQAQTFRFGLTLSPTLTGNFVYRNGSVPDVVIAFYKEKEITTFGYSAFLFSEYKLHPRASLRMGIGYARSGYRTQQQEFIFDLPEPNAPKYTRTVYEYQDVMVPVWFKYTPFKHKPGFYLIGGPGAQMKLARTNILIRTYANGEKSISKNEDTTTDFRTFNVNGAFGMGYDLPLSAQKHLFIQPTFDCNLLGTSKTAGLNRKIFTLGLQIGLILG